MRLRLRIERNSLPPVQTIWPISNPKSTIAQLLQSLDRTFPLESDDWGLEDYSVSIGDFELLHYHVVQDVCKDEDVVVLKPLSFQDIRARTMGGRDQVTADGRHLLDGIPFGRPALKGPRRPEVRIPATAGRELGKNPTWEEISELIPREIDNDSLERLLLKDHGEDGGRMYERRWDNDLVPGEEDSEDDEDDEDFALDDDVHDTDEGGSDKENISEGESDESDESEEIEVSEWEGFDAREPNLPQVSNDTSSSESDSDDTESSSGTSSDTSDSTSESSEDSDQSVRPKHAISLPSQLSQTSDTSTHAGTKRKRSLGSDDHVTNSLGSSVANPPPIGSLPFQGLTKTKKRNARRRDINRLKHLKEINELPQSSTLQDLESYDLAKANASPLAGLVEGAADSGVDLSGDRPRPDEGLTWAPPPQDGSLQPDGFVTKNATQQTAPNTKKVRKNKTAPDDLEVKRQELLAQIASGGIDVTDDARARTQEKASEPAVEMQEILQRPSEISAEIPPTLNENVPLSADSRRARLDVASTQRLLFGSLGVRAPKTREDREKVQRKLAGTSTPKSTAHTQIEPPQDPNANDNPTVIVQDELDPEAWRSKIRLQAVECCDDNIKLSEPPFPFRQRWDPQQKQKHKRGKKGRGSGATRGSPGDTYVETYDKYNINGDGDALDYDDTGHWDGEYWEEGALLEDTSSGQEVDAPAANGEGTDDDFPPLPADVESLSPLQLDELKTGDLVVYTSLACDATTNWQPKMMTRSAKVLSLPGDADADGHADLKTFSIQMAKRDLMPVEFDNEGNRMYGKFEMPDDEDESVAKGIQTVEWDEMNDVRLLSRPVQWDELIEVRL